MSETQTHSDRDNSSETHECRARSSAYKRGPSSSSNEIIASPQNATDDVRGNSGCRRPRGGGGRLHYSRCTANLTSLHTDVPNIPRGQFSYRPLPPHDAPNNARESRSVCVFFRQLGNQHCRTNFGTLSPTATEAHAKLARLLFYSGLLFIRAAVASLRDSFLVSKARAAV